MKRILFIDDDEIVLETFKILMDGYNLDITTFNNGQEALDSALNSDFDLIITDMEMPELRGADLVKEVRKIKGDIPIYILSGKWEQESLKEARSCGATGLMDKPFSVSKIISLLGIK